MNLKELKELIKLFEEAEITELEIEREGVKIKLRKGKEKDVVVDTSQTQHVVTPALAEREEKKRVPADKNLITIEAPMVGTFFMAPSPEAPPFVEEGSDIEKGEVLCIIEAMKLMNEIKSEIKGKIKKVLVENGHSVEYGEPLFLIEPLP